MVNKKDASGASRTKAAKLTIGGKLKSGMVLLSDSVKKTDWYRLTLKEKKKFTILIDAYVSGKLKVEVCWLLFFASNNTSTHWFFYY